MCVCVSRKTHTHTPYSLAHAKQEVELGPRGGTTMSENITFLFYSV